MKINKKTVDAFYTIHRTLGNKSELIFDDVYRA
jgi:hypothetical protein